MSVYPQSPEGGMYGDKPHGDIATGGMDWYTKLTEELEEYEEQFRPTSVGGMSSDTITVPIVYGTRRILGTLIQTGLRWPHQDSRLSI